MTTFRTVFPLMKIASRSRGSRSGFTLVELLISVALTVLIMSMFVQIFQLASASINQQKGIANLDQSERTLTTILRDDVSRRTFRDVVPFKPGQKTDGFTGSNYVPSRRRGYFSVSENDPNNNADDVLSLTIQVVNPDNPADETSQPVIDLFGQVGKPVLFGKATLLKNPNFPVTPNQPEFDDGNPTPDNRGSSSAAEVCYFLRNGNLYRRVLLIRDTYDDAGSGKDQPKELDDPALNNPDPNFDYGTLIAPSPPNGNGSGQFWRDFDYSAYRLIDPSTGNPVGLLSFHSVRESLSNSSTAPLVAGIYPRSLGIPHLRFGHDVLTGLPREFVGTVANPQFIGRFTAQETANSAFGYPGRLPSAGTKPAGGNPFSPTTPLSLDPATGLVTKYENDPSHSRRGEDILLTNVHEFDIKVWDDQAVAFVDLGNNSGVGYYSAARNQNSTYGNRYDTWHPSSGLGPVPYRPISNGPDGKPGVAGVDDDGNGKIDDIPMNGTPPERGWLGSDDERPLKAIQITIRFFDVTSNRMRQLTLVLSLVD